MHIASADPTLTLATLPDDRKAEQQRAAQAAHRASDLDYVRRAMTARDVRCGPGPDRPEAQEQTHG